MDKEIKLLEDIGCISKSLGSWAAPVILVPKKARPFKSSKTTAFLSLRLQVLNKTINAVHNGNSVKSYYLLPKLTDLARFQKCTIFSSLHLRSGCHHMGLTPEAKPKTAFITTSHKWYWNVVQFGICSLTGVFCYLM